MMRNLMNAN